MGESLKLPLYAIVSTDIRRDLVVPMRHFSKLRIVHLYRRVSFGDLAQDELDSSLVPYGSPSGLLRCLWRMRPDVMQGVEPFAVRLLPYLYSVWAASLLLRAPLVVVALENRPLVQKHGRLVASVLRTVLRPVLDRADLLIVLNEGARRNVLSVGAYQEKMQRVMYGTWGVDLAEFAPEQGAQSRSPGQGPVVLFVGRLHREKGGFELLDAFGLIRARVPNARLLLVGDGPARAEIENVVASRDWTSCVTLMGMVLNRDLPRIMRTAEVLVAPSLTTPKWEEQVGMSSIQAMACGVPVVSTRSGAIPEYVPDGVAGLLVPERDSGALAEAVIRILSDQDLRLRLGRAARAYAMEHYDERANVQRVEQIILERCLGK